MSKVNKIEYKIRDHQKAIDRAENEICAYQRKIETLRQSIGTHSADIHALNVDLRHERHIESLESLRRIF